MNSKKIVRLKRDMVEYYVPIAMESFGQVVTMAKKGGFLKETTEVTYQGTATCMVVDGVSKIDFGKVDQYSHLKRDFVKVRTFFQGECLVPAEMVEVLEEDSPISTKRLLLG